MLFSIENIMFSSKTMLFSIENMLLSIENDVVFDQNDVDQCEAHLGDALRERRSASPRKRRTVIRERPPANPAHIDVFPKATAP